MQGFSDMTVRALDLLIFLLLGGGFYGLFRRFRAGEALRGAVSKSRAELEELARRRKNERRQAIQELAERETIFVRIDRDLEYSGLSRRFPHLSAERLIALDLCVITVSVILLSPLLGWLGSLLFAALMILAQLLAIRIGKARNLRRTSDNLLKFLDFLGNYSLTGGELGSVLGQISRYLDEPLRGVLEDCEVESRITGDVGTAILQAADRIEHPEFQQFIRNLEITARYSADFAPLITDSRRSMREYLRQGAERKTMLREACINMTLLGLMSVLVLIIVGRLIEGSVLPILLHTMVGHIALGVVAWILFLFLRQALEMNR